MAQLHIPLSDERAECRCQNTELQHRIMIEAVENHMPEVVVIDEIGTELEAIAARTIAERGVQLVATATRQYSRQRHQQPDAIRPCRRHTWP